MGNLNRRGVYNLTFLIFSQTFLLGWATFSLKLVSLLKLLEDLSFSAYPPLMLIQGFTLYFCLKIFSKIAAKSSNRFYLVTLISALMVIFLGISPSVKSLFPFANNWVYACIIFLFSSISLLGIEISSKTLISNKISVLQNPRISGQLAFTQEIGIISGALLSLLINKIFPQQFTFFAIFPVVLTMAFFFFMKKIEDEDEVGKKTIDEEELKELSKEEIQKRYSFLPYFIALITIVATLKNIQGFAMILGIKELNDTSAISLKEIFSYLSIAQTLLILGVLSPSLFKTKTSTSWIKGFDRLFQVQAASMGLLTLFSPPFLLIGTGALRKVMQRGFFNKSYTMLLSTIPKKMQFRVQSKSQRIASSLSFIILSVLSYLSIKGWISYKVVWLLCGVLAIIGIKIRKQLVKMLNSFQINTITKFHKKYISMYDAVNSCYSLANKEASPHYDALSLLLFWNPKPILTKAVIYSLGEMHNQKNVDTIFKSFRKFPREDIQSLAIRSLKNYKSHKVDIFVKSAIEEVFATDLPLGELRTHLTLTIYDYDPDMTLSLIKRAMLTYKSNIVANLKLLEVIGERANLTKEPELYEILYKYFHRKYEKVTRVKVSQYLFNNRKYRKEVLIFIDSLRESLSSNDQSAIAYLSGCLKLKENLSLIQKLSSEKKSQNPIYLIALMQLGDNRANGYFLNLIENLPQELAVNYMKRIHTTLSIEKKYALYYELLKNHSHSIETFLEILRLTEKNYDVDRQTIFNEAIKMNIKLSEEFTLFNDLGKSKKTA